jgi:cation-transporting P-type ATPase E
MTTAESTNQVTTQPLAATDGKNAPLKAPSGIPRGLTDAEADARRAEGKGNQVKQDTSRTFKQIIRDNLFTFINITLIAIGLILVLLGQYKDAVMSSGLAVLNACVGIFQEARAKRRLDQIALLTRPTAFVVREGQIREVNPDQLVIGDILLARAGDQVMLDGHVVSGEMDVDESLLTGETDLIHKKPGDPVYAGTYCVNGAAYFEAEKVGADTVAGGITAGARVFKRSLTPVQMDVNAIVKVLLAIAVFLLSLELLGSLIWSNPFNDTVVGAAVILGIVPSGLFLMITVTYSMGAVRLAHEDALVQQMNAVESLSHVNVFCADKTGTLTSNRLQLAALQPIGIEEDRLKLIAGCLASSTTAGNKTSDAIGVACPVEKQKLVDEVPFSSARKWSAVAIDSNDLRGVIAMGAPEMLSPLLSSSGDLTPPEGWADQGLRVLLVAFSPNVTPIHNAKDEPALPSMEPVGWLGFSDELRPNLKETLEGFRETNVQIKIISGDNPDTVAALARQAGFSGEAKLYSGLELAEMSDPEFEQAAEEGTIFGRITPEQKERIVDALRKHGHYVAMTGDGVNDVLSLKKANLGIAMQSGSQATRAAADIILLNDSFAAVPAAFREGQRIRRGLQDILDVFLVRVFSVTLILLGVVFVRGGFPFAPANMTLLTLLTVGIPTFALALYAHPGRARGRILNPLLQFVFPATVIQFITAFSVYILFYFIHDVDLTLLRNGEMGSDRLAGTDPGALARDALTYVMILSGLWLVVFVSPPNKWWAVVEETDHDWRPTMVAIAMVPLYIAILTIPTLRDFFSVRLLSVRDYLIIAIAATLQALVLRYIWKEQIFERFFGYTSPHKWDPDPDTGKSIVAARARASALAYRLPFFRRWSPQGRSRP